MVPEIPAPIEHKVREFLALLERWNQRHALTALPPNERREELIQDSMALLPFLQALPPGARVIDFGTGMGIPALPLALARPDLRFLALDASSKKIAFVRQAALELGLKNLEPLGGRAEQLSPLGGDLGLAKAVGSLELLLGWWKRHGNPGAAFLALKAAEEAAPQGWTLTPHPYQLPNRGHRWVLRLNEAGAP